MKDKEARDSIVYLETHPQLPKHLVIRYCPKCKHSTLQEKMRNECYGMFYTGPSYSDKASQCLVCGSKITEECNRVIKKEDK